jgi:hypothetical protein
MAKKKKRRHFSPEDKVAVISSRIAAFVRVRELVASIPRQIVGELQPIDGTVDTHVKARTHLRGVVERTDIDGKIGAVGSLEKQRWYSAGVYGVHRYMLLN